MVILADIYPLCVDVGFRILVQKYIFVSIKTIQIGPLGHLYASTRFYSSIQPLTLLF